MKMEGHSHGRRYRRGRGNSQHPNVQPIVLPDQETPTQQHVIVPQTRKDKPWSLISSISSFLIMASLIAIIYMMLDYHCNTCAARCNIYNISKNIEDITDNLAIMKNNYKDLELKVALFSKELPKLEGQIEILESFANIAPIDYGRIAWDPKSHLCLPNVDVYLNQCPGVTEGTEVSNSAQKNKTKQCHHCPKPVRVQ